MDDNELNFICHICGKKYGQPKKFITHINNHERDRARNFKCSKCDHVFTRKYNLKRHMISHKIESVPSYDNFECHLCSKKFSRKDNLHRHISNHGKFNKNFICEKCNLQFSVKYDLRKHISKVHSSMYKKRKRISCGHTCTVCHETHLTRHQILEHFKQIHQLQIFIENYSFENEDSFKSWKRDIEKQCRTTYRKRSSYKGQLIKREIYICNRSGFYMPSVEQSDRRRSLKIQGSKKINGLCPSKIIVRVENNGFRKVEFIKNHIGHSCDDQQLAHMRFLTEEKNFVEKVDADIPSQIIEDITSDYCELSNTSESHEDIEEKRNDVWNLAEFQDRGELITKDIYVCNRSGFDMETVQESDCKRFLRIQGSEKINELCPSEMKIDVKYEGEASSTNILPNTINKLVILDSNVEEFLIPNTNLLENNIKEVTIPDTGIEELTFNNVDLLENSIEEVVISSSTELTEDFTQCSELNDDLTQCRDEEVEKLIEKCRSLIYFSLDNEKKWDYMLQSIKRIECVLQSMEVSKPNTVECIFRS